jgi:hypothetical protein
MSVHKNLDLRWVYKTGVLVGESKRRLNFGAQIRLEGAQKASVGFSSVKKTFEIQKSSTYK